MQQSNHENPEQERFGADEHKRVTAMIPRYLSDDLSDRELLAFLTHVRNCHTCYEELETAFMVDRTVHYLDNDLDDDLEGSYDLPALMEEDIKKKISDARKRGVIRRFLSVLILAAAAAVLLALLDFFGIVQITRLF